MCALNFVAVAVVNLLMTLYCIVDSFFQWLQNVLQKGHVAESDRRVMGCLFRKGVGTGLGSRERSQLPMGMGTGCPKMHYEPHVILGRSLTTWDTDKIGIASISNDQPLSLRALNPASRSSGS